MKKIFYILLFFLSVNFYSVHANTEYDSLKSEIAQLKEQNSNLKKENEKSSSQQTMHVLVIVLVPTVVAFSFLFFVLYRNRREAFFTGKENEMKRQVAEVEMKALRAQINPHFIYNCLNSIHRFMYANRMSEAGEYLVKFSNLVRLVLENSLHREVSLQDDLFAMNLYIEMEQLRMDHHFDYVLRVEPGLDPQNILVPPLILQPFVENSIWHGLNSKPERGTITISISRDGDMLKYSVEDDGVKATAADVQLLENIRKKSIGLSLTRERLDLLNREKGTNAGFTVSDILDEQKNYKGKRVELRLPLMVSAN
jgi:LytS/YehU family sensor histidine kinase